MKVSGVISTLEESLQLLCITGVEDQLQTDVRPTLELLRNAGIRVSLRTGPNKKSNAMKCVTGSPEPLNCVHYECVCVLLSILILL